MSSGATPPRDPLALGRVVYVNGLPMKVVSYTDSSNPQQNRVVLVAVDREDGDREVAGDVQFAVNWLNRLMKEAADGMRFDVEFVQMERFGGRGYPCLSIDCLRRIE